MNETGESLRLVTASVDDDGVATLRLSDPGRRNALTKKMSDDLEHQVGTVIGEGARAIVLTADPPVFSAGGSLDSLLSGEFPLEVMFAGYTAIAHSPVPTVAAVGGPALGAGLNLALACDVIVASGQARFESRFLDIGMHPGGGHIRRLTQSIGRQATAAMVIFSQPLTAEEAVAAGLVWRCFDDEDLEREATNLARRAARRPPGLLARTRETLAVAADDADTDTAFQFEMDAQLWSMTQPEFHESVHRMKMRIEEKKDQTGALK